MCGFDSHCELQAYPNRRGKRGSANCTSSHALLSWQSAWNSWDVPRLTLTAKSCPGKQRQAQIDGRGIQCIQVLIQLHAQRIVSIQGARNTDENLSEVGIDSPV